MNDKTIVYKQLRKTTKGLFFLIIIGTILALVIGVLISFGLNTHPELIIWGFLSFTPLALILILLLIVSLIKNAFIIKSRHSDLWNAQRNRHAPLLERLGAQIKIQNLDDSGLRRSSKTKLYWGISCLLLWIIVYSFVSIGASVFKIKFLIDFLNNFK
jgi:hypothetical protein